MLAVGSLSPCKRLLQCWENLVSGQGAGDAIRGLNAFQTCPGHFSSGEPPARWPALGPARRGTISLAVLPWASASPSLPDSLASNQHVFSLGLLIPPVGQQAWGCFFS